MATLVAQVTESSGMSAGIARLRPTYPPVGALVILLVSSAFLCSRVFKAVGQRVAPIAHKHALVVAAVILAAFAGTGIYMQSRKSPMSPARTSGAASINQPGDRSRLEDKIFSGGTHVSGGTRQHVVFTLRNTGTVNWISRWLCRSDDPAMNSHDYLRTEECLPIPITPAGQTADVEVDVEVANREGPLLAEFKMSDGKGAWSFGGTEPIRIKLNVAPQSGR
jgi:hypothetical protein